MQFHVIGINHHTASLHIREKIALAESEFIEFFNYVKSQAAAQQAQFALLSTCNRTEIYVTNQSPDALFEALVHFKNIDKSLLHEHIYRFDDHQALTHALKVAAGLDSMVLGEPQIFGQFKQAVRLSLQHNCLSNQTAAPFQHIFAGVKRIRNETKLGELAVSMGYAAAQLASEIFGALKKQHLLIVATGEMNQLVAEHLISQGVEHITVCNRTLENAERFITHLNARFKQHTLSFSCVPLTELNHVLPRADIVCASSGSREPLIYRSMVEQALIVRKHKPMVMIDLAVPRDIHPDVAELEDVFLNTLDDIERIVTQNTQKRQTEALEALHLVHTIVQDIEKQQHIHSLKPTFIDIQQHAEHVRAETFEKAKQALEQGQDPLVVVEQLSKQLTAKLLHRHFSSIKHLATEQPTNPSE